MKKIFLLVLISSVLVACNYTDAKSEKKTKQELVDNVRFKIFPTENIWNFLKLDTKSGKIWQVQYSVNEDYRGETELNDKALVSGDDAENGRFTLYPTKNMYNFILLDQVNGKMWQVQWSIDEENRMTIPIDGY